MDGGSWALRFEVQQFSTKVCVQALCWAMDGGSWALRSLRTARAVLGREGVDVLRGLVGSLPFINVGGAPHRLCSLIFLGQVMTEVTTEVKA